VRPTHATLILNGHDPVYARFAPMDPAGNVDPRHGIREPIIGTGGESLDTLNPSTPNLQPGRPTRSDPLRPSPTGRPPDGAPHW
jgi:hypothetical protein